MANLPKELMDALNEPETVKVLTTIGEDGNPHSVFKHSLIALDDETLAYIELIEKSETDINMLRNKWAKKLISMAVFNQKSNVAYQIKGEALRLILQGPIWDQFLEKTWSMLPEADPVGVWTIKVVDVLNEDYGVRRKEVTGRFKPELYSRWARYTTRKRA